MDRVTLASYIDHTLLKPEATPADVVALCSEANHLGVAAIAAVCGFPSGAHHAQVKAAEAAGSVSDGAGEIDMVIDLGRALDGDWGTVEQDISDVRRAIEDATVLKVIIESAALDDDAIVAACRASEDAGADFVKTSTGFHPRGGASVEAVRLMSEVVGGRLGIKASGGIRTAEQALAMIDAGATRLGCSSSRAILDAVASPGT